MIGLNNELWWHGHITLITWFRFNGLSCYLLCGQVWQDWIITYRYLQASFKIRDKPFKGFKILIYVQTALFTAYVTSWVLYYSTRYCEQRKDKYEPGDLIRIIFIIFLSIAVVIAVQTTMAFGYSLHVIRGKIREMSAHDKNCKQSDMTIFAHFVTVCSMNLILIFIGSVIVYGY